MRQVLTARKRTKNGIVKAPTELWLVWIITISVVIIIIDCDDYYDQSDNHNNHRPKIVINICDDHQLEWWTMYTGLWLNLLMMTNHRDWLIQHNQWSSIISDDYHLPEIAAWFEHFYMTKLFFAIFCNICKVLQRIVK